MPRFAVAIACAGFAFARAPDALAEEDTVRECVTAHAAGQELQNQGQLLPARAKFTQCMAERCPALVREDCAALERALVATLPTVVLEALDVDGQPTSAIVVSVDGAPATRLDGRPLPLEPGAHRFRFQRADGTSRELSVSLATSDKQRRIVADFRPPTAAVSQPSSTARTAIIVSGGVAALALGSFTYFALSGAAIESDLDACKPNCPDPGELDRMQARYLAADISLGVALVSLGVGAYVWLKNPTAFAQGHALRAPRFALGFSPARAAGGFSLSARGDF